MATPKIVVIQDCLISGYTETGDMAAAMGLGAGSFIQKPYTLDKIRQALKKELSR